MTASLFKRLSRRSREHFYDVYKYFDWPSSLTEEQFWMSPELLSVNGTKFGNELLESQLMRLSQLETINLFSVFLRGESDLLRTVVEVAIKPQFDDCAEYLSHFIDEENKHMWFFRTFCEKYYGRPMDVKQFALPSTFSPAMEEFLALVRIVLFEEVGDFFNVRVMKDETVPDIVRQIHKRHHDDEVGHISVGWKLAERLCARLARTEPPGELQKADWYLQRYAHWVSLALYNPHVYSELGMAEPYNVRTQLTEAPERQLVHAQILKRAEGRLKALWVQVESSRLRESVA